MAIDPVMLPDLDRLIKLQHLDSRIHDARQTIAGQPQRLAATEARLADAQAALETTRHRLKHCHDARRALEKDAALYQGRLTKFKDQLSAVKTNREYTAMQHEIATAQSELGAAEEKVLERMMEADALEAEVKQGEAALAAQRRQAEAEKKELAEELATLQESLTKASESRAALLKELEPRLVALFEQVARARKGVALCSATRDGLCSVCHVRLRPAVFQQVRHNDTIVQCDSCQRILYYVPPPPPVEHPIVRT
ncbi:MAG TPA: C4-type zinc ribbon domain-containing protein [Vicinamibacterales bacterium]